mgnify:CR=1 FL=1
MRLLKITDREIPELDRHFEEVENVSVEDVAPEVRDNTANVKVKGKPVEGFDAVYTEIPQNNAIFGRVLLEIIEEKGLKTNYPSTAFFIMSKKNYLYHVLHEKKVPSVKTAVIASEKASRNIESELKGPLIARRFDEDLENERTKLSTVEEINEFADGIDHGNKFVVFHELNRGDKYRCLVCGDSCISLMDNSDDWDFSKDNLQYHSISKDQKEIVMKARKAIGTPVAEVLLRDGKVEDVNPNPDLEMYKEISGKNAYKDVVEAIKGDE